MSFVDINMAINRAILVLLVAVSVVPTSSNVSITCMLCVLLHVIMVGRIQNSVAAIKALNLFHISTPKGT